MFFFGPLDPIPILLVIFLFLVASWLVSDTLRGMPTSSVAYHRINNCIERLIKIVGPGETQKHLGKLESKNLTDMTGHVSSVL